MSRGNQDPQTTSWWERNRGRVGGTAAIVGVVAVFGGFATVGALNSASQDRLATVLQNDMPRTGFSGNIMNDSSWPNQATADLNVDKHCTLDGVIVDFTPVGSSDRITGYELDIYHPESGGHTDTTFTGRADIQKAFAGKTCLQTAAELNTSDIYTGAQ